MTARVALRVPARWVVSALLCLGVVVLPGALIADASTLGVRPTQTTDPGGGQLLPPTAPSQVISEVAPAGGTRVPRPSVPAPSPPSVASTPAPSTAPGPAAPGAPPRPAVPAQDEGVPESVTALLVALAIACTAGLLLALVPMVRALSVLRDAVAPHRSGRPVGASPSRLSFSLIVPARASTDDLTRTVDSLAALNHPVFEVLAVVGDEATRTAAREVAARYPGIVRVVDAAGAPAAVESVHGALQAAQGDVVALFEPGDLVHGELLTAVARRIETDDAHRVRVLGVQVDIGSSWWSLHESLSVLLGLGHVARLPSVGERVTGRASVLFVPMDELGRGREWDLRPLHAGASVEGTVVHVEITAARRGVRTRGEWAGLRARQDRDRLGLLAPAAVPGLARDARLRVQALAVLPALRVAAVVGLGVCLAGAALLPWPVAAVMAAPLPPLGAMIVLRGLALRRLVRCVRPDGGARRVDVALFFVPYQLAVAWATVRGPRVGTTTDTCPPPAPADRAPQPGRRALAPTGGA